MLRLREATPLTAPLCCSRTMLLTGHTPPWPLIVAHSASMTLLGFLDALVYGQVTTHTHTHTDTGHAPLT